MRNTDFEQFYNIFSFKFDFDKDYLASVTSVAFAYHLGASPSDFGSIQTHQEVKWFNTTDFGNSMVILLI